MAPAVGRNKKNAKSPPIFSHEFIIQNHGDIVSCIAMLAIGGLLFQATSPYALIFIVLQHNVTLNDSSGREEIKYTYGSKDSAPIFFYTLTSIIVHAIIQEYIFDKLNKRMKLSKVKHSKFNESSQLVVFYALSVFAGFYIIFKENYLSSISELWESYPLVNMTFYMKFYYILQISYWIHSFPELYFQKIKKDEIWPKVQYYAMYLFFISSCYFLNMSLLGLVLLTLHYMAEFLFHASRLNYFAEINKAANIGFAIWNFLFVLIRLITITLAVLTLWYGMSKTSIESIDIELGNFNTFQIRLNCLAALFLLQAWIMWNFITFHLRRMRDHKEELLVPKLRNASASPSKKKKIENGEEKFVKSALHIEEKVENGNAKQKKQR